MTPSEEQMMREFLVSFGFLLIGLGVGTWILITVNALQERKKKRNRTNRRA